MKKDFSETATNSEIENLHLNAARRLMQRVPFADVVGGLSEQEEAEGGWYEDIEFWAQQLERSEIRDIAPQKVITDARNFRELECLVRALDNLEDIGSMTVLSHEYVEPKHMKSD